jgi:hypothetical protein
MLRVKQKTSYSLLERSQEPYLGPGMDESDNFVKDVRLKFSWKELSCIVTENDQEVIKPAQGAIKKSMHSREGDSKQQSCKH